MLLNTSQVGTRIQFQNSDIKGPGREVHPVVWTTEEVNVDAVVNGGVFLCMKPGFYHFSAAISPNGGTRLGIHIVHNSRNKVYAR